MALPTFTGSAFQITAVSFSPSTVAYGETTTMSVTVKNTSGAKVTKVCVWGHASIPAVDYKVVATSDTTYHSIDGPFYYFAGTAYYDEAQFKTVSWAANATMTFSGEVFIGNTVPSREDKVNLPEYHWGACKNWSSSTHEASDIGIRFNVYQPNGNNGDCWNINLQGTPDELLHIISRRDNPKLTLSVDRAANGVADDEGESLMTSIKLTTDTTESVFTSHGYTRSITCTPNPAGGVALGSSLAQMIVGVTDSTSAISGTFNNGTDFELTLSVSNGYESASAKASIPKSFANVHLSGKRSGGLCIGGFSSAEEGVPKLESYFPAYFYGGISDIKVTRYEDLTYASGFGAYAGHEARVSRIGCMVFLEGMITTTKASASTSSAIVMATLPAWAWPRVRVNALQQGSNYYLWWLTVTPDGNVCAQRYRSSGSTSYTTIASGAQLPVSACWIAADAYTDELFPSYEKLVTIVPYEYAASSKYSSDYPVTNAFNGSGSNAWASTAADTDKSITITLPRAYKSIKVSVYSRNNSNGGAPATITCTLGNTATGLVTSTAKTVSLDATTQKLTTCAEIANIDMQNDTGYNFIKLGFTNGSMQKYVAIGYITLKGIAA